MNDTQTNPRLRLIVSLEPRAYSEVIGATIEALRPNLEVEVVSLEALCRELVRLSPQMVLCSQPSRVGGGTLTPYWIEYQPYAEPPREIVFVNGEGTGMTNVEMDDLLDLVDRGAFLYASR